MMFTGTAPFRDALPDGGVLLGLDPGTKTIGLALCDAGWRQLDAGRSNRFCAGGFPLSKARRF